MSGGDGYDVPPPGETFDRLGTVGVEEEFFLVDDAGRPTAGTDELVYEREPPAILDGRLDHELFKCVIETQTPTADGPGAAVTDLRAVRRALVEHAAPEFRVAAAGLHPAARWRELAHAEKPRYRSQLDRLQYPQHRNTTAGLHVHVGVDDPDRAVWVADRVRSWLPLLLALSANSPYWNGFDTGLASARSVVFEALPHTGTPTAFGDFDAYRAFERRMVESGAVRDRGELWYDVRPHTVHGTVEVRTPDARRDPAVVEAFVETVHALVVDLAARAADGESVPVERRELLDASKWRATRHGQEATLFAPRASERAGLVEVATLAADLADRLGVDAPRVLADREGGASRQRRLREDSPARLRESLVLDPDARDSR